MDIKFKGIIFDMDGTLTEPVIDFSIIREKLNVPQGTDLLEYSKNMNDGDRKKYFEIIEYYESKSLEKLKFQKNSKDILSNFKKNGIRLGIITRNTKKHSDIVLNKFGIYFDPVLTREFDFVKPDPRPVLFILEKWNLPQKDVLIVGDFKDDILSGTNAGISTCFFQNKEKLSYSDIADYTVESYIELERLVLNK